MNVRIDALGEADLEAALDIDVDSFVASETATATGTDPRSARAQSLREELLRPWARLRAARDDTGAVVGYALFWHVVDEIHLLNVAVASAHRRRGIGRSLVEDLIQYARARAAARILLEVRRRNAPAIALYEALGFVEFNVRPRYYADGEDALEMALDLGTA